MLNVILTYNPYFVTTDIIIDGKEISSPSKLYEMCLHERLQTWIDKFLIEIFKTYRDKNVVIDFKGTALDADDLRSAIQQYNEKNSGHDFSIGKIESKQTGSHRVTALKSLFEDGKKGPFAETFNKADMQAAFDRALDPIFEVNVIATMSAGKSTVINALLGKELLPARNEACTATIARVQNDAEAPSFTAQRFGKHGKALSSIVEANKELLDEWNEDSATCCIEIKGNIPTVQQTDECTMVFVDTPGPNNSRHEDHRRITYDVIKNKPLSMVLYILNSTQLSTNDDRKLLDLVCEAMSAGGRQAQDRFVFVANKMDEFDPEKGESVTRALKNIREYLQDRDSTGIVRGIENPLIIPVSAELAKLLRKKRNGEDLSQRERKKLNSDIDLFVEEPEMNMVEHTKHRLNGECARRLKERIEKAQNKEELAEVHSGIPIIEELLNDFLQKHAMPAKLKDAVDSFDRVIKEAKLAEKMKQLLAEKDAEIAEAIKNIHNFQEDKKRIEMGRDFRKKIKDMKYEISPKARNIVEEIQRRVEKVCSDLNSLLSDSQADPGSAERAIADAIEKCKSFDSEVIVTLKQSLKDEYFDVMTQLRNEYQNYVETVLKESFPEGSVLKDLQAVSMDMPSVPDLIQDHTESVRESYSVTDSLFEDWNIFKLKWTKKSRTRDVYVDRDYINLAVIAEEITSELRAGVMRNVAAFDKQAKENVEKAKEKLLKVMDSIDDKVKEVQDELIAAQNDKEKKELERQKNQEKLDWYNDFSSKLQNILAV